MGVSVSGCLLSIFAIIMLIAWLRVNPTSLEISEGCAPIPVLDTKCLASSKLTFI